MLKEFLWGTPKEIEANKRYSEFRKRNRLSVIQQAELPEVRQLSRRLFLRRGVMVIGGAAVLTSPIAAYVVSYLHGEQAGVRYDGPIKDLRGLEYVSERSMGEMTNALENTGHPVLEKIASGIRMLRSAQTRPQEFPDWIDEESFPFVFVQDSTNTFAIGFQISKTSGDNVKFVIPSEGVTEPQEGIDKFLVGIKLA